MLNAREGNPLDPNTWEPLPIDGPIPLTPETGSDRVLRFLHGDEVLANVSEAMSLHVTELTKKYKGAEREA